MFRLAKTPRRLGAWAVCLLAVGAGCQDDVGPCYPVEGRLLAGGQPLRGLAGTVLFKPDPAKGNGCPFQPGGTIDGEGHYVLSTNGKKGAPPGWYRVVVAAAPPGTGDREVVRRPAVGARYTAEKTTPLSVQVVAEPAPGAYDLKLTRN